MADATTLANRLEHLRTQDPNCCQRDPHQLWEDAQTNALETALDRYQALADKRRLSILTMLSHVEELCACEIQAALDRSHATVNHHMDKLEAADLVHAEKRGRWVYYHLSDDAKRWLP